MENLALRFVSVIIPVFNDAARLKFCLAALETQSYPQSHYEVIVVDNGSDNDQDIQGVVAGFKQAIVTQELIPGSYAARNKGISLAKGEIIAFTDADCIPATDWIEKGVQHLLNTPNCGLVAGEIKVFFKNPERLTPVELFEKVTAFKQKEYLEKYKYGATANLFTFKSVIEDVGYFNNNLKSSGDLEWGVRVAAFNYQQVYAVDTCVAHPARYSFKQIYKRTTRIVGGSYDLQLNKNYSFLQRKKVLLKSLLEDLLPPLNFIIKVFKDFQLNGIGEKLRVSFVMLFIRYVSAWERIRLMLGGVSIRE
jgi:glycosyltransferase involved in cell wall biosynthesis